METVPFLGAGLLPNELAPLQIIVGGFALWWMLMTVLGIWLSSPPAAKSGLDKYGGHYSDKHGGYHCVTGRFAGKIFTSREEMLKLAA